MHLKRTGSGWEVNGRLHGTHFILNLLYYQYYIFGLSHGRRVYKDGSIINFRHGKSHGHVLHKEGEKVKYLRTRIDFVLTGVYYFRGPVLNT